MERARSQPGQFQLARPFPNGPLAHFDSEATGDLRAQIDATPANHAMPLRIGAFQNRRLQFGHLLAGQRRRLARTMARFQALDPLRVIPVHPVARRLAIHPGLSRGFSPGLAVQHRREREQAADLGTITAFRCHRGRSSAVCSSRVMASGLPIRSSFGRGAALKTSKRTTGPIPRPRESQRFGRLV